ncbi:MAG: MEDS domain-containing protein [Euryarchaeota archaeon]|nr:MEDS domain-containing protein [Euryarchaeota archaeon]
MESDHGASEREPKGTKSATADGTRAAADSEERELQDVADDLDEARRLLKRSNEALDSFSYVLGHDLREPVRAVEIQLAMLERRHGDTLPPDALALVQSARSANHRLVGLLSGLLEFSQAAHTDLTRRESISIDTVLHSEACTARFGVLAAERGARLEHPEPGAQAYATLPALAAILGNLVLNAIQHNPKDAPLVRVRTVRASKNTVDIIIEDDGPGFPDHVIAALTGEGSTPTQGFGLAITRRTVERLGGRMRLGRSPEGGAAVHVTLPSPPRDLRWRASVTSHDHAACVYDTRDELAQALAHFVDEGIHRRELIVFVHSFASDEEAWRFLERSRSDAPKLRKSSVLLVSLYREVFQGDSDRIDYEHVAAVVGTQLETASARGHEGVRIFVDASRIYLNAGRADEWFAFESWLGRRLSAGAGLVCAYRASDLVDADQLSRMIDAHAYRFTPAASVS